MDIEEQNKIIAVEKAEAETALAEVMPILEAAKLELQKLDKSDVTEIRYRAGPPPAGLVPSITPESSTVVVAERARPTSSFAEEGRGAREARWLALGPQLVGSSAAGLEPRLTPTGRLGSRAGWGGGRVLCESVLSMGMHSGPGSTRWNDSKAPPWGPG